MADTAQKLIKRSKRLSFMKTTDDKYVRMTKFTSLSDSKDAKEYSRQYVDEDSETSDVVGYASGVAYELDRHTGNVVHDMIAKITDEELTGPEARVEIVSVDLFESATGNVANTCNARLRTFSVIPDGSGDGTDSLKYSGTFKSASRITKGTATTADDWQSITFTKTEA